MTNYKTEDKLDWLKQIHPNFKFEKWHFESVLLPSDTLNFKYYDRTGCTKKTINPKQIIGIEYAYSYNSPFLGGKRTEINWLDLFFQLKRLDWVIDNFDTRKKLEDHIYFNDERKCVFKYGGSYFTVGGQHRLCLAKLLGIEKITVDVIEYKLNKEKLRSNLLLKKQFITLRKYELVKSKNGYKTSYLDDYVFLNIMKEQIIIKKELIREFIELYENLYFPRIISRIIILFFRVNYPSNFENIWIKDSSQLKLLKYVILKHKINLVDDK